jgi:hypothetical protein
MVNTETGNQRYHRLMSEQLPSGPPSPSGTGGFPTSRGQFPGAAAGPPPWPSTPPPRQSRALTFATLAIALIATVLAIVGWFRPSTAPPPPRSTSPTYTDQHIADAKTRACNALTLVNKAAIANSGSGAPPQQSADPAMAEARAADSRLSVIAGAWYLRDHLSPATPQDVTTAIQHLSEVALDLGQGYLAGAQNNDPAQADLIKEGNSAFKHALELCK